MKFGVREICDLTFKTTADGQKVGKTVFPKAGMPAFSIDTARTSNLEQATTTVYAQGGKGYNRLIAWEGEKTMTFTVEDALISPMGLSVLSGAGLLTAAVDNVRHVHVTLDAAVAKDENDATKGIAKVYLADLREETGLNEATKFVVCTAEVAPAYATVIDGSGAGIEFIPTVTIAGGKPSAMNDGLDVEEGTPAIFEVDAKYIGKTVKLDFYLIMTAGVSEIEIKPNDFGGFFYVEAQTLFRREDTGMDMAAEIILPRVKVQSGFTFTMSASGDPSVFNFTMDAFPGYTKFDHTKKVMCVIQVIGTDETTDDSNADHEHKYPEIETVTTKVASTGVAHVGQLAQENQDMIVVAQAGTNIVVGVNGELNTYASTDIGQGNGKWIALEIATGFESITEVKYNGTTLTEKDVADAESLGLPAGSFVLWVKAENLPKVFTLSAENREDTVYTVSLSA